MEQRQLKLLVLFGADWTLHRWGKTTGELEGCPVLVERVSPKPSSEFAVSHVTCAGSFQAIYASNSWQFFFRGTNGMIYNCISRGPDWQIFDLSAQSTEGVTALRPCSSDLSVLEHNGTIHIFFIGIDNRLRELYKAPLRPWRHVSLRRHVGGSVCALPPQTRPFACVDADGCLHVFFKNDEHRVGECYWKMKRSKWRVFDTSEYIPKHGAIQTIFDVVTDNGPHIFFLSCDGPDRKPTYHHVFWAQNSWVSSYWGTQEGIQTFEDPPGSPDPDYRLVPTSSDPSPSSSSTSPSNGPPLPPPPPPAPIKSANGTNLKVAKIQTSPKDPLVVHLPMKDGKHRGKLNKYKSVRLVVISDTHNYPERVGGLPPGDILVHCGDFTVYGKGSEIKDFADWLDSQTQYKYKVVIAGNHEVNADRAKKILSDHCIWLDDKTVDVMGLTFYGTSWGCDYSALPTKGIDVLLTHKPPAGHGDVIYTGVSRGSESLAVSVRKMKPILHAFGHNHEGFGATCDSHTVYINAATCMGSARSSARRGSIVVDIYPDLKSKYGVITAADAQQISSSTSANTESLVQRALEALPI